MAKSRRKLHSEIGWNYNKVDKIIYKIHDIFDRERITFVEQLVVLDWFHAELIYNMSKHGIADTLQDKELMKKLWNEQTPVHSEIYG